jgi:hypothetical protein
MHQAELPYRCFQSEDREEGEGVIVNPKILSKHVVEPCKIEKFD